MHISRANSVVFAYVSTLYETCSRHVVSLTTANWLRFWLEDAQTILCNTWHDKLPFDQPTCRLLTHSGRKTLFFILFFFFFLGDFCSIFNTCNNSDQWNSQDQNFWKKCWNYEFLGSSIIKQIIPYILLPISHTFMCRMRSLWYAKTVDTFQLRSIHAHWPSSLVYWRWISYLVESFNFVKKYSSFFFFILIVWSYDCNERNIYIYLCIIYIVR